MVKKNDTLSLASELDLIKREREQLDREREQLDRERRALEKLKSKVIEFKDPNAEKDWTKVMQKCVGPFCGGKTGAILPMFGIRKSKGVTYKQTWCRVCRSESSKTKSARQRAYAPKRRGEK